MYLRTDSPLCGGAGGVAGALLLLLLRARWRLPAAAAGRWLLVAVPQLTSRHMITFYINWPLDAMEDASDGWLLAKELFLLSKPPCAHRCGGTSEHL